MERRHDLDWIRVGAFFLLILYHVGMFYVPWDWHVKSPRPQEWLAPVMQLTNPWRLSLLFLVSGAATRFMADKVTAGSLAWQRTLRLLPPLVLAIFVVVPPQSFYEVVEKWGFAGSYAGFYGRYVTASGGWRTPDYWLITPTYNHMWFVAYLFVYTLVLALLIAFARPFLVSVERTVERLGGWGLIVWPLAVLAALRLTLYPVFEVTHAFVDDWYNHAVSFGLFLFGYAMAKSARLRAEFIRMRWPALAIAVAAYGLWASYAWAYRAEDASPPEALMTVMRLVYAVDQWCAIAAALGFGARHLNRGSERLTYLTLAVFPFYIVHQTL
ncbi:MAG TPA: acyltransferase family protein, partial [Caulobacteraceae bacterium]|nr:acyltransferase family protein [Caulobacteraceae bacterium]